MLPFNNSFLKKIHICTELEVHWQAFEEKF